MHQNQIKTSSAKLIHILIGEQLGHSITEYMDKKKKQKDADKENKRVDELVMDLFQLSEADKQSIRDFTFKSH